MKKPPKVYVTDYRHLVDPLTAPPDCPRAALAIGDFMRRVVAVASAHPVDEGPIYSALWCRASAGGHKCRGTIAVKRQEVPEPVIEWGCEVCQQSGVIRHWQGSLSDLTALGQRRAAVGVVEVDISRSELEALARAGLVDPSAHDLAATATMDWDSERVLLHGTMDELEQAVEGLSEASAHVERAEAAAFDGLIALLERALEE